MQYDALCAVTTPPCQNQHEHGRLTCAAHSGLENTYNYYNSLGGWHIEQRARAAGVYQEVKLTRIVCCYVSPKDCLGFCGFGPTTSKRTFLFYMPRNGAAATIKITSQAGLSIAYTSHQHTLHFHVPIVILAHVSVLRIPARVHAVSQEYVR